MDAPPAADAEMGGDGEQPRRRRDRNPSADVGLHGNTHFPMSDLNNEDVASLLAEWLHEKGLD